MANCSFTIFPAQVNKFTVSHGIKIHEAGIQIFELNAERMKSFHAFVEGGAQLVEFLEKAMHHDRRRARDAFYVDLGLLGGQGVAPFAQVFEHAFDDR